MLLAFVISIPAELAPEVPVPLISNQYFSYTADQMLLTIVFLAGASIGAIKNFPIWSYTWIVMAIGNGSWFAGATGAALLFGLDDPSPIQMGMVTSLFGLGGLLVTLVFAASRVSSGLRNCFFIVAIGYVSSIVTVSLVNSWNGSLGLSTYLVNAYLIVFNLLVLAILIVSVMRFVSGNETAQRRSFYVILLVTIISPLFTYWTVFSNVPSGSWTFVIQPLFFATASRLGYFIVSLLITWGLAIGFRNWTRRRNRNSG